MMEVGGKKKEKVDELNIDRRTMTDNDDDDDSC